MERFELNIVAQGSQSIWVAALVIAFICITVCAITTAYVAVKFGKARGP